jgi:hypothetical protein
MTVAAVGPNTYEFTADGDRLLDVIKVESFIAMTDAAGGEVLVYTRIFDPSLHPGNPAYDATNRKLLWSSGTMNANAVAESAISMDYYYGLEVSMPAGARLVAVCN